MNTQERNYSGVAAVESLDASNKNISSVLSQIQDDGPAYSETKEREKLVNSKTANKRNNNDVSSTELREKYLYTKESLLGSSTMQNSNKKKTWLQYLIVLSLTVCVMFFMYQMDDRANKLEALISNYDEEIQESVESYSKESPTIIQLNADLASMKNELNLINSNVKTEFQETEEISHIDIQDEIVSSLEDEIQILKIELNKANNDLKTQLGKNEPLEKNNINIIKSDKQLVASWSVNLAALSNKYKVDEIVNQLNADGIKPTVDEVTVNGQLIYRISVGGFAKFVQAELFVEIAEEEYGMKGGWIKKVSNG